MRNFGNRMTRLAACIFATVACANAQAGADPTQVHGDGFEPRDPREWVQEAVDLSLGIRLAFAENWYSTGRQLGLAQLGLPDPYPAGAALATLQSGTLVLQFGGELAGQSLAVALWRQGDIASWVCGYAPPPLEAALVSGSASAIHTTMPDEWLPDACRSNPSPGLRVQDVVDRAAVARLGVAEFWISNGVMPMTLAEAGMQDPLPAAQARLHLDDGVIVANFIGDLAGESLGFALWLQANAIRWVCGNAPPPVDATRVSGTTSGARTSLPVEWLPEACRNDPSPASQVLDLYYGSNSARNAVEDHWVGDGIVVGSLAEAGLQDPLPVAQARVVFEDGVIVATFAGDLEGQRLGIKLWKQQDGLPFWVCGHADAHAGLTPLGSGSASAQTTLHVDLLPEWCR